jgi:hypothetical protein
MTFLSELIKSEQSVNKFVAEYYRNIKPPKFEFGIILENNTKEKKYDNNNN